jgi:hypothetical protein
MMGGVEGEVNEVESECVSGVVWYAIEEGWFVMEVECCELKVGWRKGGWHQ